MTWAEIAYLIGPRNPIGEVCTNCGQCCPWVGCLCFECFHYTEMRPYGSFGKVRRIRTKPASAAAAARKNKS